MNTHIQTKPRDRETLKLIEFKAEGTHPFRSGLYTSHEKFKELIANSPVRKYIYNQLKERLRTSSDANKYYEMTLAPFSEEMINNMQLDVVFSGGKVHIEVKGVVVELFSRVGIPPRTQVSESPLAAKMNYIGAQAIDREVATITIGSIGIKEIEVDSSPCLIRS